MAYVLVSDIVVDDPEGKLPVLGPNGLMDSTLGRYYNDLSARGFNLSASETVALSTFIRNLREAGIWDSVIEIYPLIGNSAETAAVKLKYLSESVMAPVNSIDNSHFEFDGEGRLLGKDVRPTSGSNNQPYFGTGVTVGDLNDSWMVTALLGSMRQDPGTSVVGALWGASQISGAAHRTEVRFSSSTPVVFLENQSRNNTPTLTLEDAWYPDGIYQGRASGTDLDIYINDEQMISKGAINRNMSGSDSELGLFALNPFTPDITTGYFQGKVRFFVLSKNITANEQKVIHDEVARVTQALGRSF